MFKYLGSYGIITLGSFKAKDMKLMKEIRVMMELKRMSTKQRRLSLLSLIGLAWGKDEGEMRCLQQPAATSDDEDELVPPDLDAFWAYLIREVFGKDEWCHNEEKRLQEELRLRIIVYSHPAIHGTKEPYDIDLTKVYHDTFAAIDDEMLKKAGCLKSSSENRSNEDDEELLDPGDSEDIEQEMSSWSIEQKMTKMQEQVQVLVETTAQLQEQFKAQQEAFEQMLAQWRSGSAPPPPLPPPPPPS